MATITNTSRLPEPIVRAITNDTYTKGNADFSVTELLSPPQISRLRHQHRAEIVEDAADRIWSLLGQSVHAIIERNGSPNELTETTLVTTFEGKTIKGTFDSVTVATAELNDYKITTAWKIRGGEVPDDWEAQTNIYRWMLKRELNIDINAIAIIVILRDWSKREAARSPDYPQTQALRLEVPLWPAELVEAFVTARLAAHADPDIGCSDEDIWAKPSKWAVMQKGRKTAVKLYDNEADASASLLSNQYVEYRPGQATRCESYCPVAAFCPQWQADPRRPTTTMEPLFS